MEQIGKGDYVKDRKGRIHRVFDRRGKVLHTARHRGGNSYGGTDRHHVDKVSKTARPSDVTEGTTIKKLDRGKVTGHLQHFGYSQRNLPHLADRLTKLTGQKHSADKDDIYVNQKKGSAKMAEDTQIDEISRDMKNRYIDRASRDHGGANMARRHTTPGTKDHEYFKRKEKTLKKGITRASRADMLDQTNDSYEPQGDQIDEISVGLAKRYLKKSVRDGHRQLSKMDDADEKSMKASAPGKKVGAKFAKHRDNYDKASAKFDRRERGQWSAADRINKESVVNELSGDKVHDYLQKSMNASDDANYKMNRALDKTAKSKTATSTGRLLKVANKASATRTKRNLGIDLALRKQTGKARVNATESKEEDIARAMRTVDKQTKIAQQAKWGKKGMKGITKSTKSMSNEGKVLNKIKKILNHPNPPVSKGMNDTDFLKHQRKHNVALGTAFNRLNTYQKAGRSATNEMNDKQPTGVHISMKDKAGKVTKTTFLGTHSAVAGAKKHIADLTKKGHTLHSKELAFAEEVEQVDELSNKTLAKYAQKSQKSKHDLEYSERPLGGKKKYANYSDADHAKVTRKLKTRGAGFNTAVNKMIKKSVGEGVEQVDESQTLKPNSIYNIMVGKKLAKGRYKGQGSGQSHSFRMMHAHPTGHKKGQLIDLHPSRVMPDEANEAKVPANYGKMMDTKKMKVRKQVKLGPKKSASDRMNQILNKAARKEGVEQVDEISSELKKSYTDKEDVQIDEAGQRGSATKKDHASVNDPKNQERMKQGKSHFRYSSASKNHVQWKPASATESVEHIDELSRGTLHRYKKAASRDIESSKIKQKGSFWKDAHTDNIANRKKGIKSAQSSLWGKKPTVKEASSKDQAAPFDNAKKVDRVVTDKSGAKHDPMSRAKNASRLGLKQFINKNK
jgi:hypothetical protein